ncbi:hypothetical protein [Pleionea mediterranea]|nr:hypothetical protein [Pleionea mediterranea]
MIKTIIILIAMGCLLGCSQQKLTIFYDESYSSTAHTVQQQLKKQQNNLEIEIKLVDFYHDFRLVTLIHGANVNWQPVADTVHQLTGLYPGIYPAAIGKHFYHSGQMGLYLVSSFKTERLYSCLANNAFFEITGKPGSSVMEVTLFGDQESDDKVIKVSNVKVLDGVITYHHADIGDVSLYPKGKHFKLKSKDFRCNFNMRNLPVLNAS